MKIETVLKFTVDGSGEDFGLSRAQKVRSYLSGSYSENPDQIDYNFLSYR